MQRRRISRRGLFGQAAGLATAALLPMPAIAETRQVKFTLPWLAQGSYAFVYVANAKDILKKRGIEMSVARGFGSFATEQSITAGTFDIGLCAAPALTLSVAKGLPLIALATTDYDATMGVGVLADSPIQKPQELMPRRSGSISAPSSRCMSTTRSSSACFRKSRSMRSPTLPPAATRC